MLLSVFLLLWTANRNHQTSQQHVDKNHQCQGKILAEHVAPVCVTCKESCTEKNSACNMSIPLFPAHLIFCVYLSPTCFICCACISLGNYFSASLCAPLFPLLCSANTATAVCNRNSGKHCLSLSCMGLGVHEFRHFSLSLSDLMLS